VLIVDRGRPVARLEIVTLDDRLAAAARKEGFALIEVPRIERCPGVANRKGEEAADHDRS
jgi:hypothetical protein